MGKVKKQTNTGKAIKHVKQKKTSTTTSLPKIRGYLYTFYPENPKTIEYKRTWETIHKLDRIKAKRRKKK